MKGASVASLGSSGVVVMLSAVMANPPMDLKEKVRAFVNLYRCDVVGLGVLMGAFSLSIWPRVGSVL